MVGHAGQTHQQVVAGGLVQHLRDGVDHARVLVLLAVQQVVPVLVHVELELHEVLHDVVQLGGVLVRKLAHGLARDLLGDECPGAVDLADLDDLGNVDAGLVRAGEVQRLVEDVRGRLRGVEDLGDGVTAVVDDLVVTGPDDLLVLG